MDNKIKSSTSETFITCMIVGCGRVSVKHLKAILKLPHKLKLIGLVDSNPNAFNQLCKLAKLSSVQTQQLLSSLKLYSTLDQVWENEIPQIMALNVPSGLHYSMAKIALAKGCHLLLEKPMTMDSAEALELYQLSNHLNRKIAMGHIYRYFPLMSLLAHDIKTGEFGKLSHGNVVVRWGHDQAYYDQADWRGNWRQDGGALMNQTIHAIDLICWLMGSHPVKITGLIGQRFHQMEAEDIALGSLELANGAFCQVEGTTNTPTQQHEAHFLIYGSKKTLSIGLKKGIPYFKITSRQGKNLTWGYLKRELKAQGIKQILQKTNPHWGIYLDLAESINQDCQPIADAWAGYKSVETALGLYKSALEQQTITLPLEESFSTTKMEDYTFL